MATQLRKLLEQKEKLLREEEQLRAQLRDLTMRQKSIEKKDNNRRKALIGACVLDAIKKGDIAESQIRSMLDKFLKKVTERALFDLAENQGEQHAN